MIPLALLPSKARVKAPADGEYAGKYAAPVTIEHVRFDRATALVNSGYVLSDGAKGVVFIDALASKGAFEVPVGSLMAIDDGDDMHVSKVTPYAGFFGKVHHWEIEVS
jgi:hypothetical protein